MAEIYLKLRVKGHLEELPAGGSICPVCGEKSWGDMVVMATTVSFDDGSTWRMERHDDVACVSCAGDKITRDLDRLDGELIPEDVSREIEDLLGES